jgi:kynurenine 3-monooxygenase
VLDVLLRKHRVNPANVAEPGEIDEGLANALQEYSDTRYEDLAAIGDLAMAN